MLYSGGKKKSVLGEITTKNKFKKKGKEKLSLKKKRKRNNF